MTRIITVLTVGLGLSFSSLGQENNHIAMPINTICNTNQMVMDAIKDYDETAFAQGTGMIFSSKDGSRYQGNIKVYLSSEGSFTITAEIDPGIECVVTSGIDFKPIVSTENMH